MVMEVDILLLTVYFICLGYVTYQMALSLEAELEDQIKILPDHEVLKSSVQDQLARQGLPPTLAEVIAMAPSPLKPLLSLQLHILNSRPLGSEAEREIDGQVIVQVLPQGPQLIQPIKALTIQVLNQTRNFQVSVDWDRSSFTRMNNQTCRVIRHTPGMRFDLALPQVISVVNPRQLLSTQVTSEETFGRHPDTQVLQVSSPLINLPQLVALPPRSRVYTLDLAVQVLPLSGRGSRIGLLLPFQFQVEVLPAKIPIPYLDWILRR